MKLQWILTLNLFKFPEPLRELLYYLADGGHVYLGMTAGTADFKLETIVKILEEELREVDMRRFKEGN